jgi:lipid-A-disaccharide synthase-like uncharacterized protein
MSLAELALTIFGFVGQLLFFMRFIIQWLYTEKYKKSAVPVSFWYYSIFGSFMLLTYSVLIKDPIFIIGQSTGAIIYLRNISLIYKERGTRSHNFGFKMFLMLLVYFAFVGIAAYFWYFSMIGSLLLLIYSVMVHDPVFIAGQSVGLLIYFRNLYFIRLEKKSNDA